MSALALDETDRLFHSDVDFGVTAHLGRHRQQGAVLRLFGLGEVAQFNTHVLLLELGGGVMPRSEKRITDERRREPSK